MMFEDILLIHMCLESMGPPRQLGNISLRVLGREHANTLMARTTRLTPATAQNVYARLERSMLRIGAASIITHSARPVNLVIKATV